jgi:large subunit ribosomal protein L4
MLRGALRSALAVKFQNHKLTVVDQLDPTEAKTKRLASVLKHLGVQKTVLIVNDLRSRNLELSSRNLAGCDLVPHYQVHPYHLLSHDQLLISEGALTRLQEALR